MVRFGAKKEEFIPPFLFYTFHPKKKRRRNPSFYTLILHLKRAYLCSLYNALTASQSTTLKNALM